MGRKLLPTQPEGLFDHLDIPPIAPTAPSVLSAIDPEVVRGHDNPHPIEIVQDQPTTSGVDLHRVSDDTEPQLPLEAQFLSTADQTRLQRLVAYEGLLLTFGKINNSDTFRQTHATNVVARALPLARRGLHTDTMFRLSEEKVIKHEDRGRKYVARMYRLGEHVTRGEMTETEAGLVRDEKYDLLKQQWSGVQNTPERRQELAKVRRRIKKIYQKTQVDTE